MEGLERQGEGEIAAFVQEQCVPMVLSVVGLAVARSPKNLISKIERRSEVLNGVPHVS